MLSLFTIIHSITTFIYNRIYQSIYKPLIHLLTQQSEIHRLFSQRNPPRYTHAQQCIQLHIILSRSKQLRSVYYKLQDTSPLKKYIHLDTLVYISPAYIPFHATENNELHLQIHQMSLELAKSMCTVKHIDHKSIKLSLKNCIMSIIYLNHLKYNIVPFLIQPYDTYNPLHNQLLENVWNHTVVPLHKHNASEHTPTSASAYASASDASSQPPPYQRYSDHWSTIGFQNQDPSTDFRSLGILSLIQLSVFSSECTSECMKLLLNLQQHGHLKWFSVAITGINITDDILTLLYNKESSERVENYLKRRYLYLPHTQLIDEFLYTYTPSLAALNLLYITLFIRFNEYWEKHQPDTVMEFNGIHHKFLKDIYSELKYKKFTPNRDVVNRLYESSSLKSK